MKEGGNLWSFGYLLLEHRKRNYCLSFKLCVDSCISFLYSFEDFINAYSGNLCFLFYGGFAKQRNIARFES